MLLMTQYDLCDAAALGDNCTTTTECSGVNAICDNNGVCSCDTATHYPSGQLCSTCMYSDWYIVFILIYDIQFLIPKDIYYCK